MTPEGRATRVLKEWSQTLGASSHKASSRELMRLVVEEIAAAVAEETEACAAVVEQQLAGGACHPRGIPGAIRERRPIAEEPSRRQAGMPATH